jgi:hypothetical protein
LRPQGLEFGQDLPDVHIFVGRELPRRGELNFLGANGTLQKRDLRADGFDRFTGVGIAAAQPERIVGAARAPGDWTPR